MKYFILSTTILLFLISIQEIDAQELRPPIRNFSTKEYKEHAQNWAVIQDKRGIIYIANTQNILEYDGMNWRTIPVKKRTVILSLSMDSTGRIFVGAEAEFGYLSPDSNGKMNYISLSDHLDEKEKDFKDVWTVLATPDGVYFQTFDKLFLWNEKDFKIYKPHTRFHRIFYINNRLYVKQNHKPLMYLYKDSLISISNTESLQEDRIYGILSLEKKNHLLAVREKGLLLTNLNDPDPEPTGAPLKPLSTELNNFLVNSQMYGTQLLPGNKISVNTIYGGIAIIENTGKLFIKINKKSGLQDENVWHTYLDFQNNLWLGLNKGISRVEFNSPLSLYGEESGFSGRISSIIRFNGILYLSTSSGVYYFNESEMKFLPVGEIHTQSWYLFQCGNSLLAGTIQGVFEIRNMNMFSVSEKDAYYMLHSEFDTNRVYVGGRDGLYTLIKNPKTNGKNMAKWIVGMEYKEISRDIITLFEMYNSQTPNRSELWMGTRYQGLVRMTITKNENSHSNLKKLEKPIEKYQIFSYDSSHHLPDGQIRTFTIQNRMILGTEKGLYRYAGENKQNKKIFVADTTLGKQMSDGSMGIFRLKENNTGDIYLSSEVFANNRTEIGICKKNNKYAPTPFLGIDIGQINAIYPEPNGICWLGGVDGLMRYDPQVKKDYQKNYHTLIRKVTVGKDSILFWGCFWHGTVQENISGIPEKKLNEHRIPALIQPNSMVPVLDYKFNSFAFEYAATFYEQEDKNLYQYKLEGFDKDWSDWISDTRIQFTNLPDGNYFFKVKAKNIYNHISSVAVYRFEITPPFYKTWWFYSSQMIFIIILFGASYYFSQRKEVAKLATAFVTVSIVILFEYIQNIIESNFEDVTVGVIFFKFLLYVVLILLLLPIEFISQGLMNKKPPLS